MGRRPLRPTAELVSQHVGVIVTGNATAAALAAKAATSTIPIVFTVGADPVQFGLVASLNRPGGNVTGVSFLSNLLVAKQVGLLQELVPAASEFVPIVFNLGSDPVKLGLVSSLNQPGGNVTGVSYLAASLVPKLLETLHEVVPSANVVAILANPNFADTQTILDTTQTAARAIGQHLVVMNASTDGEINTAFKSIAQQHVNALVVLPDPFFTSRRQQIVALAASQGKPAICLPDAYRQVGIYTAKILRGAKPAELPVQEAVKVDLILNLKTAKSLGMLMSLIDPFRKSRTRFYCDTQGS